MKAVMISIQPKWVEKIASGGKTIEVRKSCPNIDRPFKVYIYCTYGKANENYMLGKRGKVIGEFVCDRVGEYKFNWAEFTAYANRTYLISEKQLKNTCLSREEFNAYGCAENEHKEKLYGWHISDLKIYDKPKELSEFKVGCPPTNQINGDCNFCKYINFSYYGKPPTCNAYLKRPPQSWCYVEVE